MIAADNEMGASVVAADNRVQQNLLRPRQPHRQGQQAQHHAPLLEIVVHERPVTPHPRVMVNVARLGHSHNRVDQEPAPDLPGRSLGELFMRSVQRVPRLERDNLAPAQRLEVLPQLLGRPAQTDEIIVRRNPDHLQPARRVMPRQPIQIRDRRMLGVR